MVDAPYCSVVMLTTSLVAVAGVSTLIYGAEAQGINATDSNATNVDLLVSTKASGRNETAPLLYGWMIEDINVRRRTWLI